MTKWPTDLSHSFWTDLVSIFAVVRSRCVRFWKSEWSSPPLPKCLLNPINFSVNDDGGGKSVAKSCGSSHRVLVGSCSSRAEILNEKMARGVWRTHENTAGKVAWNRPCLCSWCEITQPYLGTTSTENIFVHRGQKRSLLNFQDNKVDWVNILS